MMMIPEYSDDEIPEEGDDLDHKEEPYMIMDDILHDSLPRILGHNRNFHEFAQK